MSIQKKSNDTLIKTLVSQIECRDIKLKQFDIKLKESERELDIANIKLKEKTTRLKSTILLNKVLTGLLIVSVISCIYYICH